MVVAALVEVIAQAGIKYRIDLLFENPHQIIKKERIIEKIWGGDSDAEYNNVEVYISFIRKKIDQLKVKTQIRTARGIGYSLEEGK